DFPVADACAVILHGNDPAGFAAVAGGVPVRAGLEPCQPIGTADLVLDDLHAVHPVLDVRAVRDDADLVPGSGRPGDVLRRRVEAVAGAGRAQATRTVGMPGVV